MCEPEAELDYVGIGDLCLHLPLKEISDLVGVGFFCCCWFFWFFGGLFVCFLGFFFPLAFTRHGFYLKRKEKKA